MICQIGSIKIFTDMKYIKKDFAKTLFSVPSFTCFEFRMIEFLAEWAEENHIHWHQDDYGNLYLTKGNKQEGDYYPCVCAHLDTVFEDQIELIVGDEKLTILERTTEKGTELFARHTGIGADDKAGILISLEMIKRAPIIKACFFCEEEIGCLGSQNLDEGWFSDVGYVIGWDSPERNRAAHSSSGIALFDMDFYDRIKEICAKHGVTDFRSEPFTDVSEIRKRIGIMCMNIGNGGYKWHRKEEFVVLEETDEAVGLGMALIEHLGRKRYTLPYNPEDAIRMFKIFRR